MGVPVDLVGHELLVFQTCRQKTGSSTNTVLVSRLFSELMFGSAGLGDDWGGNQGKSTSLMSLPFDKKKNKSPSSSLFFSFFFVYIFILSDAKRPVCVPLAQQCNTQKKLKRRGPVTGIDSRSVGDTIDFPVRDPETEANGRLE